ncbi:epoxide hydrolase 4-like [Haliotis rufescens]|uniref:epoxide hydrolase 4-like n=1 Tax=Haliotis rufescens TaxID=6454 RepID=UPI00201EFF44|nr:epoxide hydrolase 4-like [Haliotis rufescens]
MAIKDIFFRWISFGLGCFYSTFVFFALFALFVRHPIAFFSRKKRDVMPSVLNDPDLGTHGYVHLEEVKIHYVAQGDETKPLMLFVHGFPEFWYSWRYQLREFKKDYRVVAIDLRGYGDSDKPSGISNYNISKMVADLKQLIPALGYKSCVLVAHDWGGAIAWTFTAMHPELVDKLIMMNCPPLDAFRSYMEKSLAQFKKSWYVFFFQVPFLPEWSLRLNDMWALEGILTGRQYGVTTEIDEIEAYKYAFSRPGVATASINYYRALTRFPPSKTPKISCPVLTIWGCKDAFLEKALGAAGNTVADNYTVKYIEEASHWVMMDTPDQVNKHMTEFLK